MPRNSGGTYTLPVGNPVVSGTVISSTWGNTTLSDLATEMTDSLSRSGEGGMLAALGLFAGAIGAPGLSWTAETTSGLYRAGAGDFRWAQGGADILRIQAAAFTSNVQSIFSAVGGAGSLATVYITSTLPIWALNETDAAADNRRWDFLANGESLLFRAINDADSLATAWCQVERTGITIDSITLTSSSLFYSGIVQLSSAFPTNLLGAFNIDSAVPGFTLRESDGAANNRVWRFYVNSEQLAFDVINDAGSATTTWLQVDRTGTTVDTVNFPNATLQYGGVEVGYRGFRLSRSISGADNTTATDLAGIIVATGGGGYTFTLDAESTNGILTIINASSASITIATSTSFLSWFNGSGTIGSGSRTLAVAGAATAYYNGSGWNIWGTGLS